MLKEAICYQIAKCYLKAKKAIRFLKAEKQYTTFKLKSYMLP